MSINGPTHAVEYLNAFFSLFTRGEFRLSSQGDKVLKLCALLAIPPPPPGIVAEAVSLPPHLEAVALEQLSEVVLGLAEVALAMPHTLRPHGRVVVEELLPELERLMGIPKCSWCLHPSNRCPCGGVPPQAQGPAPTTPADRPPSYQQATSRAPQGAPAARPSADSGSQSLGLSIPNQPWPTLCPSWEAIRRNLRLCGHSRWGNKA